MYFYVSQNSQSLKIAAMTSNRWVALALSLHGLAQRLSRLRLGYLWGCCTMPSIKQSEGCQIGTNNLI